jgi:hypothetical protein
MSDPARDIGNATLLAWIQPDEPDVEGNNLARAVRATSSSVGASSGWNSKLPSGRSAYTPAPRAAASAWPSTTSSCASRRNWASRQSTPGPRCTAGSRRGHDHDHDLLRGDRRNKPTFLHAASHNYGPIPRGLRAQVGFERVPGPKNVPCSAIPIAFGSHHDGSGRRDDRRGHGCPGRVHRRLIALPEEARDRRGAALRGAASELAVHRGHLCLDGASEAFGVG